MEIYLVGDEYNPRYLGPDQDDAVDAARENDIDEIAVFTLDRTVEGEKTIKFEF